MIELLSEVDGAAEEAARLDGIADLMRERVVFGLRSIGEQVRERAEALAPKKTGSMAGTISEHLREAKESLTETVSVAFPGKFLEFGVRHYGTLRNRAVAGLKTALKEHGVWRVPPQPFMRPALHSVDDFVQAVLLQALQDIVKGEA